MNSEQFLASFLCSNSNVVTTLPSSWHADVSHVGLAGMAKCSICEEWFLIQVNSAGSHKHCATDKHIPKLYSVLNSMDPGPVPVQLSVCVIISKKLILSLHYVMHICIYKFNYVHF